MSELTKELMELVWGTKSSPGLSDTIFCRWTQGSGAGPARLAAPRWPGRSRSVPSARGGAGGAGLWVPGKVVASGSGVSVGGAREIPEVLSRKLLRRWCCPPVCDCGVGSVARCSAVPGIPVMGTLQNGSVSPIASWAALTTWITSFLPKTIHHLARWRILAPAVPDAF